MPPISLTADQRRIIFDTLKVRPLTPDQEPSLGHLDAYVAKSGPDDPLAAQIRVWRQTTFGSLGMGSIANHLGPTIPAQTSGPLLLQKTSETGQLTLNREGLKASWFLLGFQGLYFLISDVQDSQHEYSGPKIWPLDHRQESTMTEFISLFPTDKNSHRDIEASLEAATKFLSLKKALTENFQAIETSGGAGQFILDGIPIHVHLSLIPQTNNLSDVRIKLPGGADAARRLGLLVEQSATASPQGSKKPEHPDIAKASLEKTDFLKFVAQTHELPLVFKGNVTSPSGPLKMYQAGPFVLTIPPHEKGEIEIIEIYRTQRDAEVLIADYFQREKSLVTLAAAKPNTLLVPISQLEGSSQKVIAKAFRQMDLTDYFNRQKQLKSAGVSVRKKRDGTMTLEFKPSLDLLRLFYLIPPNLDEAEIIAPAPLIGPRVDLFRLKINNPEPITVCISRFGDFYFFFKEFENGTKSPLTPLKADSINELTQKIVGQFGKTIFKNGNTYEGELPVNEDMQIKMLLFGHLIIEGHSPLEAFEQQQELLSALKMVKQDGQDYLQILKPEILEKLGLIKAKKITGPILADLKFSQVATKLVVPTQKAFSKEWFEHFPKNHAAYFEMTDDAGNKLPCVSFALTSAPHPLSAMLKDGSDKIVGFVYWDIKNNEPHVCIQTSKPGTLSQSIAEQINTARGTKDKLIADSSFYVTIVSQVSNYVLQEEGSETDIGLIGPWATKISTENEKIKLKIVHYLAGSMQGLPQQDPAFSSEFIEIFEIPNSIDKKQTKKEASLSPNWFHLRKITDTDLVFFYDTKAQILRTQDQNSFALIIANEARVDFALLAKSNAPEKQQAAIQSFLKMIDQSRQANKQLFVQTSFTNMGADSSLELNWRDGTSGEDYSLQLRTSPLQVNMNFGASLLGHAIEMPDWRIAGETIVPRQGQEPKYFLKKEAPSDITQRPEKPVKIEPQPEIPKLSEALKSIQTKIDELNFARKGLRNIPLDFANWALRKFDALTNPFKLGLQVQLKINGVPQKNIETLRDFKRQTTAKNNRSYEFTLKWGAQSDSVHYGVTASGDDFILTPTSPFDYPEPIQLSFIRKEDGSYQALFKLDPENLLYQFLDKTIYGPAIDIQIEDTADQKVKINFKGAHDTGGNFLNEILEILASFKKIDKAEAHLTKEGQWDISLVVDESQLSRIKPLLLKIASRYEESLQQKREPLWKAPVIEPKVVETLPKIAADPFVIEEKIIEFKLAKDVILKLFVSIKTQDDHQEITLNKIQVPEFPRYHLSLNNSPVTSPVMLDKTGTLKITSENYSTLYEFEIALEPVKDSVTATIINEVITKKADILQNHEVKTQIKIGEQTRKDSLGIELGSYQHPLTGERIIHVCALVLGEQEAHLLKLDPQARIKPDKISGDHQLISFKAGGAIGTIEYKLTWHEDGSVTAERMPLDYLLEYSAGEGNLLITTNTGEISIPVENIEGRLFLKGKALEKLKAFQALVGEHLFDQQASLLEVIPDTQVRFNPVTSTGSLIPLTEIKLSRPGVSSVRDAIYGPLYQASHSQLTSSGLGLNTSEEIKPLPLEETITFKPGESLIPTIKTIRMIVDAAYNLMTPSGRKQGLAFVEETPYEYELLAPESGLILRIPVLWEPSRARNPWVLDSSRFVSVYKKGQNASEARILSDPRFVAVDNGGDWQIFLLEADGDQIKRFQINALPHEKATLFIGGAQILNEQKKSPNDYKRKVIALAQAARDQMVAHVLKQAETPEEFFHFEKQTINKKGQHNALEFRFLSTNLSERRWALLDGVTWDPTHDRLTFTGPITLTIKKHPADIKPIKELKLVPVRIPDGDNEIVYLTEVQHNGMLKGHVFEWFVGQGVIGLRMMLDQKVSENDFVSLLKANNIPLLKPGQQYGFRPMQRGYLAQALHIVESKIPVLPHIYRGLGYPDPAQVNRIKDETLIKELLASVDAAYLYPTEETLLTQTLVGQRDNEKMIFYGRDMIVEIPMELSGQRYVPVRQTNPHELLKNVRLLIRNPNDRNAWYDLPVFAHPHRSAGADPVIRFLVGSTQIPFMLVQQFTRKVLGSRAASGLVAHALGDDPDTNTRNRAHLHDYLEFMDMDDEATPIYPVDFKLGEAIQLPDGRTLDLSVVKKGNAFHLSGVQFAGAEVDAQQPAFVTFTPKDKREHKGFLNIYRAAHGSALYYLKDKENRFWLMALDDQGKPLFWERKDGIRDFPMADRASFEMLGLKEQTYDSGATSTAIRLFIRDPDPVSKIKTYDIIAPLGREKGASETSAVFEASSKAIIKFRVSVDEQGKLTIQPDAKIKKKGRHEAWEEAQLETFEDATGCIKIFFKKAREDGYHDYAWIEFKNKEDLIGPEFKVATAHYNRTNWANKHIMPSEAGFMGILFGAALVYPPYAELANQLLDDESRLLAEQLKANQDGYAVVAAMMEGMDIAKDHPHWNLIFSSLLYKDHTKKQEVTLYHWPDIIRARLLSLFEGIKNNSILAGFCKLATFEAPLSLKELRELKQAIISFPQTNELLAIVCDEVSLWLEAREDFREAENFRSRELSEQAIKRAQRAYHILEILEDTQGAQQIRTWITQHHLEKETATFAPRLLEAHETILKAKPAPAPVTQAQTESAAAPRPAAAPIDLSTETLSFLPGVKNFPAWLRLPVYELIKKLAYEKGAGFNETIFPDTQWNYGSKGSHFFNLQQGNLFAQKKAGELPTLVALLKKEDVFDFLNNIYKYIDENSETLTTAESKQKLAKDIFELFKVLGVWPIRIQKYVQEIYLENKHKIFQADFSEARTTEDIKKALKTHLEQAYVIQEEFKQTQTPAAISQKRNEQGAPLMPSTWARKKGPQLEYDRPPINPVDPGPSPNDDSKGPKASLTVYTNPAQQPVHPSEAVIQGAEFCGNLACKLELEEEPLIETKRLLDEDGDEINAGNDELENNEATIGQVPLAAITSMSSNVIPLFGVRNMPR